MPHALPRPARTALALLLISPALGWCQAFDAVRLYGAAPGSDGGSVGLVFIGGKAYQGSSKDRNLIVPTVDYQWRNGWFAGLSNGIGVNLSSRPDQQYGLRLTADLGRQSSRSVALRGLDNIDPKAELGGFYNHFFSPQWFATSSLRYGAGDTSHGLVVDLGLGHTSPLAPGWRLGAGLSASWVNADYAQSFFGISSAQAAATGYPAYRAEAGVRDVRVNAALTYQLAPRASITGAVSVSSLQGDAKGSPLTRKATAANGVVAISYAF